MILQPTVLIALAMALPKIQCASVCDNINEPDNKIDTPLEIVFDCVAKNLAEKAGISIDDTEMMPVESLLEVTHYQILTIKF